MSALIVAGYHLTKTSEGPYRLAWGWVGVEIFFVLSGVVITQSANGRSAVDFLLGRFLRLYPGAWICALISFFIVRQVNWQLSALEIYTYPSRLPMLSSLVLLGNRFVTGSYWTLPIEIAFYLAVALLIHRDRFCRIERYVAFLTMLSGTYIVLLTLQYAGAIDGPSLFLGYGMANMTLLRHGIYFSIGVLLFIRSRRSLTKRGTITFVVSILIAGLEIYCRANEEASSPAEARLWAMVAITAWLISIASMIASIRFNDYFPNSPRLRSLIRIGGLATFPIYLLHESVGGGIVVFGLSNGWARLPSVLAGMIATCLVGWMIAVAIEPRLRKVFRAWIERHVMARANRAGRARRLFRPAARLEL